MLPLFFRLLLVLAAPTLGWAADAPAPAPTLANVSYGPDPKQVLDFYKAPTDKPAPLLFFIHGGGWYNGDKAKPDFLPGCAPMGISVVSINYRMVADTTAEAISPPIKAFVGDAARALQFVRSRAQEWNIDPKRVCACGGSAGACTALWLAFHPDMADPQNSDPVLRQSTRPSCVFTFVPQTSLDPQQMREWIPNIDYGQHAFGLPTFQDFLAKRDALMPLIKEYSPYALASADAPPVYLFYPEPPAMGQPGKDADHSVHSANFGAGLAAKLKSLGIDYNFNYPGSAEIKQPDLFRWIIDELQAGAVTQTAPATPAAATPATNTPASAAPTDPTTLYDPTAGTLPVEGEHATVSMVDQNGTQTLQAVFEKGVAYPNIKFNFPGGKDLSAFTGVEVDVTNPGTTPVKFCLRVDNDGDWTTNPWNGEAGEVGPGQTITLPVKFGISWGNPGFKLDPAHIISVQIYAPSPPEAATLLINRVAPFGVVAK